MIKSIVTVIRGIAKLRGDTDNTLIGNAVDALKTVIQGGDGLHIADVILKNNRKALVTDSTVTVETIFGFDDFADTWFFIIDTGAIGDTLRIQIAEGYQDITSPPDDNDPAVDVTITVTASEFRDEIALTNKIVAALNADPNFSFSWKAKNIKDNPAIHIQSKRIGEKGDRTRVNDFILTPSGTLETALQNTDNEIIKRRGKQNSGQRDPRDPRLVTVGVSGEVQAVPGAVGDLFVAYATDDGTPTGSSDLRVNGSLGNPEEFSIGPDDEKDIFINELRFFGGGNGIQFGNFLSKNQSLNNGILVEVRSDEQVIDFFPIQTTEDFKNIWSLGGPNFVLDIQAGSDQFLATLIFASPFPLRKMGTFLSGDDYVKVFIRDNLTSQVEQLQFLGFGFKEEV